MLCCYDGGDLLIDLVSEKANDPSTLVSKAIPNSEGHGVEWVHEEN